MIILDTETTDFLKPDVATLATQPHMIEIAMIQLDPVTFREVDRYEALMKPSVPLDEETHKKITGLTNADLAGAPTFLELFEEIVEFFSGQHLLICHNLTFDLGVLVCELRRIGREYAFPYPPAQVCTVERTKHLLGRRLKLTELYELKMGRKLAQKHRAMADCEALAEIVQQMKIKD